MIRYVKRFNETKIHYELLIRDNELLEKYNKIWVKVSNILDIEPVYNEKTIKTKIKSYEGKINTSFRDDRMPKEGSHCIYL